jgi:hypothetical protein
MFDPCAARECGDHKTSFDALPRQHNTYTRYYHTKPTERLKNYTIVFWAVSLLLAHENNRNNKKIRHGDSISEDIAQQEVLAAVQGRLGNGDALFSVHARNENPAGRLAPVPASLRAGTPNPDSAFPAVLFRVFLAVVVD